MKQNVAVLDFDGLLTYPGFGDRVICVSTWKVGSKIPSNKLCTDFNSSGKMCQPNSVKSGDLPNVE